MLKPRELQAQELQRLLLLQNDSLQNKALHILDHRSPSAFLWDRRYFIPAVPRNIYDNWSFRESSEHRYLTEEWVHYEADEEKARSLEEAQEDAEEQRQYRQVLTQNSEVQNLFLVLNLQQQLHGIQRAPRSFWESAYFD